MPFTPVRIPYFAISLQRTEAKTQEGRPPNFCSRPLGSCAAFYAVQYLKTRHLDSHGVEVPVTADMLRQTLREVGVRPLLQGVLLWIVVAVGSLLLIRGGWIAL